MEPRVRNGLKEVTVNRKSILQVYPTLGGPEEMARRRPIGRDNEAWQLMLESLGRMVRHADELGYWGITHVEHHFHSEGLEVSPDPGLLNLYLGLQTKRMKHGQLGYVLPSRDPIRLAEETALIDHMLQGRFFVGMARGYQTRWQNVLGQHFHVTATPMDQGEIDVKNRELFYEHYKLMKMAWTEDLLRVRTDHYEVPYVRGGHPGLASGQEHHGAVRGAGRGGRERHGARGSRRAAPLPAAASAAVPGVQRQ
jgi:alkanesulfonate monooxygenase SsuD/methylene tetrahydromethanopterin reductase-like flavin-dependent oxidoreductase (luciferase family)